MTKNVDRCNRPVRSASNGRGGRPRLRSRTLAAATVLASVLLATACSAPAPAKDLSTIEERLNKLEDRLTSLERLLTNLPSPPLRSRAEIVGNIQALERQRAALLERFTAMHPDVREIDLRLRLLRMQLDMLDQVGRAAQ